MVLDCGGLCVVRGGASVEHDDRAGDGVSGERATGSGTLQLSWPAFTTANQAVAAGRCR